MELSPEQKKQYLIRRHKDLADCLKALETLDSAVLQRVGHQIKGNALTFGYPDLGTIGDALEKAIRAQDWEASREFVLKFQAFLDQQDPSSP